MADSNDSFSSDTERDKKIRQDINAGIDAAKLLWEVHAVKMTDTLQRRLSEDYPDALSTVGDAVTDTIQRCLKREEKRGGTLLDQWNNESKKGGDAKLIAYLTKVALQHAKKLEGQRKLASTEELNEAEQTQRQDGVTEPESVEVLVDDVILQPLANKLAMIIHGLGKETPGLVTMWQLYTSWQVEQKRLAGIWQIDTGELSRRLNTLTGKIRKRLLRDDLDLISHVVRAYPLAWYGIPPGAHAKHACLTEDEKIQLKRLFGDSTGPRELLALWEKRLWQDRGALDWLAQFLRTPKKSDELPGNGIAISEVSPSAGLAAKVHVWWTQQIRQLTPMELGRLLDAEANLTTKKFLTALGVTACTIWIADVESRSLQAVFNPIEGSKIVGLKQPLEPMPGIIGMIYKLVLAPFEPDKWSSGVFNDIKGNKKHNSYIDGVTRKPTQHMLVAPFMLAGERRGVLSAVRLGADAEFFAPNDLGLLQTLGAHLASRMEAAIWRLALD